MNQILRFVLSDEGPAAVEYAVMLALIIIVAITGITTLGATNSGFWVDFYVDPSPAPLAANELWPDVSAEGIAWGVTTSILPGQVLTLTYSTASGAPNLYYSASDSLFSGALPVDTPIYAQVDSAHVGHPNGAIEEDHEIIGGVYNNIYQALATAVPTTSPPTNVPADSAPAAVLPTRH